MLISAKPVLPSPLLQPRTTLQAALNTHYTPAAMQYARTHSSAHHASTQCTVLLITITMATCVEHSAVPDTTRLHGTGPRERPSCGGRYYMTTVCRGITGQSRDAQWHYRHSQLCTTTYT